MLKQILQMTSQGETCHTTEIATKLGVSEVLVERMLFDLTRMGYLQTSGACEDGACKGCHCGDGCNSKQIWMVKKKK